MFENRLAKHTPVAVFLLSCIRIDWAFFMPKDCPYICSAIIWVAFFHCLVDIRRDQWIFKLKNWIPNNQHLPEPWCPDMLPLRLHPHPSCQPTNIIRFRPTDIINFGFSRNSLSVFTTLISGGPCIMTTRYGALKACFSLVLRSSSNFLRDGCINCQPDLFRGARDSGRTTRTRN